MANTRSELRLADQGIIILTTPNSFFWLLRIFSVFGMKPDRLQNKDHLHFFDLKGIRKVIPESASIYGYFPYCLIKMRISSFIGLLSPTFVIVIKVRK